MLIDLKRLIPAGDLYDWLLSKEEFDPNLANGDTNTDPTKQQRIEAENTLKPKDNSPKVINPNEKPLANAADFNIPKLNNKKSTIFINNSWKYVEPAALSFLDTTDNPDATDKANPRPPDLPRAPVRSQKGSQSRRTSW